MSFVRERARRCALARAAEVCGKVLDGNLEDELVLVGCPNDIDLGDRDRVKPALGDTPDGREQHRCIDYVFIVHYTSATRIHG